MTLDTSWCKAFEHPDFVVERITVDKTQSVFRGGTIWCRICEGDLTGQGPAQRKKHAQQHAKEYAHYKEQRKQQTATETKARRKELNQLKKEGKVSTPATTKSTATPREQGFPDEYLAPNGKFKPGFDSKAKSDLTATVLGIKQPKLHRFTSEKAWELIRARGWEGYVERKKRVLGKD